MLIVVLPEYRFFLTQKKQHHTLSVCYFTINVSEIRFQLTNAKFYNILISNQLLNHQYEPKAL